MVLMVCACEMGLRERERGREREGDRERASERERERPQPFKNSIVLVLYVIRYSCVMHGWCFRVSSGNRHANKRSV